MQSSHNQDAMEQQLKETIAAAEQALRQTDEFFDETGIDREKFRDFVAGQMTPELHAQAQEAFEEDMQSVKDFVATGKHQLTLGETHKPPARRMRRIV